MSKTVELVVKPKPVEPVELVIKGKSAKTKTTVVKVSTGKIQYINGKAFLRIYDASGAEVGFTCSGCGLGAVQVAPGNYTIKGKGFELKDITVKVGQTFVVDGDQ